MPNDDGYLRASLASYVVLLNADKKVFMMRRTNTEWCNGYYNVPAGKVERHETFIDTAIREAREEAGITVRAEDLELFLVQNRHEGAQDKNPDWVDVFFLAHKWENEPTIAEPKKADHAGWFAADDASIKIIPNIAEALGYLGRRQPAFALSDAETRRATACR